ncbi:MAG TPA: O-antigen ligase family protein [Pseudolabrys sp.]|nr:O-antigen ligase family protein [Pseudolabrys sp.]
MTSPPDHQSAFRTWSAQSADAFLLLAVVGLPWSISVALLFLVLWAIAAICASRFADVARELATAAAGLAAALAALAILGMTWMHGTWAEALGGADAFFKLLAIPLLFAQFRRSEAAKWIFGGYLASCTVLLTLSWIVVIWPQAAFSSGHEPGVPLKSAESQGVEFVICAFALLFIGIDGIRRRHLRLGFAAFALALLFLADLCTILIAVKPFIVPHFVLLTIVILIMILTVKAFAMRGLIAAAILVAAIGASVWICADTARGKNETAVDVIASRTHDLIGNDRLAYWTKSIGFIADAPRFGHGSGSILATFARSAADEPADHAHVTDNPHQQTLAVGIQLGLAGIAILWAMWLSQLLLFSGGSIAHWIGFTAVIQNIIGSLFQSDVADFTAGWVYVLTVGIAGGVVRALHEQTRSAD